ncbi:LysM peptidoglycan-binding domain-containing protein [Sedimentibacter hydroxybenzoicus DSM 7310]|uniref:LysM peptidoglycan-binding domain-containing protein n=1 Tax=Sedimentibacter hydroxybenzoicus DSM 7310 TaxID=1123245 RepID=A0A974BI29_SEDHY|nr:LysM peptidoglycan-binding domain-containing protein [Sedimentibacter hydroxybenzoicus]NYB73575.1 LysM peptidoglycan-binding domain-containing protein [Sedimentibacter hydroxybenzoicus DSM 7310]
MIIFNKYRITNINRFKRFVFMSVLFISIIIFASSLTINAYSKDIPQFKYINVREGDTLWSLASTYMDDIEIRKAIFEISKHNNIQNASIYPGDVIAIPVK